MAGFMNVSEHKEGVQVILKGKNEKKHNYKNRVMTYLLIIALVPVLGLGSYAYYIYMSNVTQKVNSSAKTTIHQIQNQVDSMLMNIRKSYIEEVERNEINWILNQDMSYSDYSHIVSATNILDGDKYLVDYISGFTFINFKTNWVLSNRGMYHYDLVTNKEEVEALRNYDMDALDRTFWIDHMAQEDNSSKLGRETVNLNNLSFVMKLPIMKKDPYGLLVVNINRNKLERMVSDELVDEDVTILNEKGEVVYSSNPTVGKYIQANKDRILEQESSQGRMLDGRKLIMASAQSNVIHWTYVVSCDLNTLQQGASDIITLTLLIFVLVCTLVVGTFYFANRIYKPIDFLLQHIGRSSASVVEGENEDEFEYIATRIDHLVDNNTFLEKLIKNQQSQLTELLQLRLIRGDIKPEQIDTYMSKLELKQEQYYVLMSINVRAPIDVKEYDEAKQDVLRIEVIEQMPATLNAAFLMQPIWNHKAITVVITGETEEAMNEKILEIFSQLEHYVKEKYQLTISVGVSTLFENLIEYRKAYNQSIEALKNSEAIGSTEDQEQSELIFYSDITSVEAHYTYDIVLEKEIKVAVDNGDEEEAFKILDRFIDTLAKHKIKKNEWALYVHRFLVAIMSVATDAGLLVNDLFSEEKNNIFTNVDQIYEWDQLKSFFKNEVIMPVIYGLDQYRKSKSSEIMKAIEEIVQETKGDISLAECGERLHYHPTYIWKIMKLERNITFSDYIAEYKLKEAKRLLNETKMTIAEIAVQLNYTNTQNFIRFFSKLEGTTPGKYRQQNKQNE